MKSAEDPLLWFCRTCKEEENCEPVCPFEDEIDPNDYTIGDHEPCIYCDGCQVVVRQEIIDQFNANVALGLSVDKAWERAMDKYKD